MSKVRLLLLAPKKESDMPNCKPGQLAVVIGAETPGLEGRIVEILKEYGGELSSSGIPWVASGKKLWWVTSPYPLPIMLKVTKTIIYGKERAIADRILYPINDPDISTDNITMEKDEVY